MPLCPGHPDGATERVVACTFAYGILTIRTPARPRGRNAFPPGQEIRTIVECLSHVRC